ncbi:MAG: RNA polymerase sigma factor [Fimbriimonadaceae bacterium]|nr:RNA polymerase sigma factor [Fimbriimonadaceae bacterium]
MELQAIAAHSNADHIGEHRLTNAIASKQIKNTEGHSKPSRSAFEAMISKELASFLRLAKRLAFPDEARAEDFVQDAIIKAYVGFQNGDLKLTPQTGAWIRKSIYLNFLMHRRSEKRVRYVAPELLESAKTVQPELHANQLSNDILAALEKISDEHREVIILIDLEGIEYAEAAEILSIPIGTIRSRLNRARWNMANLLRNSYGSNP